MPEVEVKSPTRFLKSSKSKSSQKKSKVHPAWNKVQSPKAHKIESSQIFKVDKWQSLFFICPTFRKFTFSFKQSQNSLNGFKQSPWPTKISWKIISPNFTCVQTIWNKLQSQKTVELKYKQLQKKSKIHEQNLAESKVDSSKDYKFQMASSKVQVHINFQLSAGKFQTASHRV